MTGTGTITVMRRIDLRVPDDLDERMKRRAGKVGLSRNAWLVKAIDWALDQPVRREWTETET